MTFLELSNKLQQINFSSKQIILDYKNEYYTFDTVNKAASWCTYLYNHISKNYFLGMIHSGFTSLDDMLKDYNSKIKRTRLYNIDNSRIKNIDLLNSIKTSQYLLHQDDLFDQTDENCKFLGICAITSVFNCYPKIFDNKIDNVRKILEKLGKYRFDNLHFVIEQINSELYNYNKKLVFEDEICNNSSELYNCIKDCIDTNRPVMLALNPKNYEKIGHVISVFGYDEFNYYFYDNEPGVTKKEIINNFEEELWKKYSSIKDNVKKLKQFDLSFGLIGFKNLSSYLKEYNVEPIKNFIKKNLFSSHNGFELVNKRLLTYTYYSFLVSHLSLGVPKDIHLSEKQRVITNNAYLKQERE